MLVASCPQEGLVPSVSMPLEKPGMAEGSTSKVASAAAMIAVPCSSAERVRVPGEPLRPVPEPGSCSSMARRPEAEPPPSSPRAAARTSR